MIQQQQRGIHRYHQTDVPPGATTVVGYIHICRKHSAERGRSIIPPLTKNIRESRPLLLGRRAGVFSSIGSPIK